MKTVFLFAFFAVMASEVISKNLFDDIPRNIEFPALTTPKTRRTGTGRILGGKEISQNDRKLFKYQVGLHFPTSFGRYNLCGGSIISERSIITAAHCTKGAIFGKVYIGLYDETDPDSADQVIQITEKNWVNHPDFGNETKTINDLAIINLPEPIKFGEFAGPIEVECDDRQRHENEKVSISGWGRHSKFKRTTILRAAEVQTISNELCRAYNRNIFPSMLCTYTTNIGVCQGDSGGPIVSTINGKLLGAGSFIMGECEDDKPRVFTRLSSFAKWIQDNSADHIKNC